MQKLSWWSCHTISSGSTNFFFKIQIWTIIVCNIFKYGRISWFLCVQELNASVLSRSACPISWITYHSLINYIKCFTFPMPLFLLLLTLFSSIPFPPFSSSPSFTFGCSSSSLFKFFFPSTIINCFFSVPILIFFILQNVQWISFWCQSLKNSP